MKITKKGRRVVVAKARAADVWERYRGFVKLRKRTDEVIRKLQGPRP